MSGNTSPRTVIPRGRRFTNEQPPAPANTDISKQAPGIRFAPNAIFLMQKGVDSIANLVRPTLGPTPRVVAVARLWGSRGPELLDGGATIARRIVEVPDAYVNMGAMLCRHTLWSVYDKAGDGSASAAVIMQALLREGIRLSAAGWNVMMMRQGVEKALEQALASVRSMARPLKTEADVAGLALAAGGDPKLAALLGEMFDTLGSDGIVQVQQGYRPGIEHDYIEGAFWDSGWITSSMATDELQREARLRDAYVLVAPDHIESWEDISPILNAVADKSGSLFIIALNVGGTALNLLLSNKEKVPNVAVKAPAWGDHQENLLQDIAVLTGTRVMMPRMGESLRKLQLEELGRVRSVVVNRDYFGLVGGHGDPKLLRQRIASLRTQITSGDFKEGDELTHLRERLAKLSGGVGVIYVGGVTEADTAERRENVERCVSTVKHAQAGGIVPGGGMAYIECAKAMRSLRLAREESVGVDILTRALEEPLRAIAANAGFDPSPIAVRAQEQQPGWGFNALSGEFEDLWAAGIVDPLPVVETVLTKAVSGALMALTTSTTVHRRNPPTSVEP